MIALQRRELRRPARTTILDERQRNGKTQVARIGLLLTSLLLLMGGVVAMAAAQTVPTKTITFYNNSADRTLYPVIQAPIMNGDGRARSVVAGAVPSRQREHPDLQHHFAVQDLCQPQWRRAAQEFRNPHRTVLHTAAADQSGQPRQGERPVHRLVERHAGLRIRRQGRSGCGVQLQRRPNRQDRPAHSRPTH